MPVAETSLHHWYTAIRPHLTDRQAVVYDALAKLGRATLKDLCAYLSVTPNAISGRITELKEIPVIEIIGRCKTQKANIYRIIPKQQELFPCPKPTHQPSNPPSL
jgi:DNA-binding MarR family transcriptional regulator